jgi:SPP1 gp7 family putative phage head morphogenesis protein
VRRAEQGYLRQLRRVARAIEDFVRGMVPAGAGEIAAETAARIEDFLWQYSELLRPWAERVAERMLVEVANRDARVWSQLGNELGVSLRREIETVPTGMMMRAALANQVHLIQSLPRDAAQRVHKLTTEGIIQGRRAKEIADDILATGHVTRSRAETIARTEVGRTATELVKARSEYIGSEEYEWVTAGDRDVRRDHARLNGRIIRWDSPPIVDRRTGRRAHAGADINCRCVPRVLIPAHFFATSTAVSQQWGPIQADAKFLRLWAQPR